MDNYEIIDRIIDRIIEREGGDRFTDRPSDRGGPTKFGITQKAWSEYIARAPTHRNLPTHVRDLTLEKAREFYWREHVSPFAFIHDDRLRELVVDCSVNHGRTRATKWLQEAADLAQDGVIGPATRAACTKAQTFGEYAGHRELYNKVLRTRFRFYAKIASDQLPADPDLPNLRGWINRACEFIR